MGSVATVTSSYRPGWCGSRLYGGTMGAGFIGTAWPFKLWKTWEILVLPVFWPFCETVLFVNPVFFPKLPIFSLESIYMTPPPPPKGPFLMGIYHLLPGAPYGLCFIDGRFRDQ